LPGKLSLRWGDEPTALVIVAPVIEIYYFKQEGFMTKFEYLAVLRSMRLAVKMGTKETVEELLDELIADAEGSKTIKTVKRINKDKE